MDLRRGVERFLGLGASLFAAGPGMAAPPSLQAEQIRPETAAQLQIGGPDAIGGIGDWYLANDVVEVIVDDPSRRNATLNHGGTLVDAGLRDRRGEDQFARLFPLANMDQKVFIDYDQIRAEVDEAAGWARLVVSSDRLNSLPKSTALARLLDPMVPEPEALVGLRVETEYVVLRGEPFVHITTTLSNHGMRPVPVFAYGDVWMRGGRSMRSFVGNTVKAKRTVGFHHKSFDRNNVLAAGDAMVPFTHVVVPGVQQFPPITYALFAPERAVRRLVNFGVTSQHVTFINTFTFDPDWARLSLWRIAQATQESIPPGETWTYRRRLLITPHNDVASATDVIFPLVGFADGSSGIRGRVEPRDRLVAVHVRLAEEGAPVTQILTRTRGPRAGEFHAVLPPRDYVLEFHSAHEPVREVPVTVESGSFAQVPTQSFDEPGWLTFDRAFADGRPGRVIVSGLGETPDPVFQPELLDFRVDDVRPPSGSATRDLIFSGRPGDPHRVAVAPGHYRLTATRGPEYDIAQREIHVRAGDEVRVDPFDLWRVADLSAFTAADLHVHAQASDDSAVPNMEVLRRTLAEGIQVLVSSDHDNLGDFGPALDALGVRDRIRVIGGAEVTSSAPSPAAPWTIGHSNTWPVTYRENAHRNGAPPSQDVGLADLYSLLRREYDVRVVQLNHPRDAERGEINRGAFFTHLATAGVGFDPDRPIAEGSNALLLEVGSDGETRPIDFDAMELMNGSSWEQYLQVRRDWYSLLSQGFRRTATANSDTHGPDEMVGYPRNYVAVDFRDDPVRFDQAVREGRLFGSNGPLIVRFSVNGARAGDTVEAPDGRANVQFAIAAAPWVPVDEVRLLVNGRVESRYPLDPHDPNALRLLERLELQLEGDAFVTLEAGAPVDVDTASWIASHPGPYTEAVAPGFVATAFSNPVFVDVDRNGRFDPPGLGALPGPPPDRALEWLGLAAAGIAGVTVLWLRRRVRARAA